MALSGMHSWSGLLRVACGLNILTQPVLQATFRAATAALRLHELERAMELCSQGLKEDDQNAEFQKLLEVFL